MQYEYPSYSGFRCVACNIGFNNFDDQKKHYFAYHSRNVNPAPAVFTQNRPMMKKKTNMNKSAMVEMKCDVCNIECSSKVTYDFHLKGKRHAKNLNKLTTVTKGIQNTSVSQPIYNNGTTNGVELKSLMLPTANLVCQDCSITCSTMDQMNTHINGIKHKKILRNKRLQELMIEKDPSVYCSTCDIYMLPDLMTLHLNGGKHKRKCSNKSTNEPATKKRKVAESVTTIEFCGYCNVGFSSSMEAVMHYQSKGHIAGVAKIKKMTPFHCETCELYVETNDLLDKHLNGYKHYIKINRGNPNPEGPMSVKLLRMREKMKAIRANKVAKVKSDSIEAANHSITLDAAAEVDYSGDVTIPMLS